jgi:hypothetical protein
VTPSDPTMEQRNWEFLDPDYLMARTTIRWAREAGCGLAERHGDCFIYILNVQKGA